MKRFLSFLLAVIPALALWGAGTQNLVLSFSPAGGGSETRVVFTSDDTWTVPGGVTSIDYLLIGGGAGGGDDDFFFTGGIGQVGGGGGGGLVEVLGYTVTPGDELSFVIGTGGDPGLFGVQSPTQGNPTTISNNTTMLLVDTAYGGYTAGADVTFNPALNGNSGGQSADGISAPGMANPPANGGGTANYTGTYADGGSGGGGGAGAVGGNGSSGTGGVGGAGSCIGATWGNDIGQGGCFSGGGGGWGGVQASGASAAGGVGNGAANTGGGGTSRNITAGGEAGWSGIAVIKYTP